MLAQVGELESSKSAMKPVAPEFSALITIFAVVGPVISTRRFCSAGGAGDDRPVALAHLARLLQEVERAARVQLGLALLAPPEQLPPAVVELAVKQRHQLERLGGQHLLGALHLGPGDLHAVAHRPPTDRHRSSTGCTTSSS